MQFVPGVPGVASGRLVSAAAMLVAAAGLALYQLTSLLLGPVSSRQLDLSLTIPAAVEVQDRSEPMVSTTNVVVGTRATPAAPPSRAMRVVASPRAASVPIKASSRPLPTVLPTPNPHPADKKRPVDD